MFSRRIPDDLRPNAIARRREAIHVEHDLTVSNPTACGLPYPPDLLQALASPRGLVYRPHPSGLRSAREAVAGALGTDPERVVLTASTSEAYALLFKLLADPGGTAAVPAPSYPLIEHLARLEGLRTIPYRLDPEDGWRPDPLALAALPGDLSVVVAVSPNNPTGSYLDAGALAELAAAAALRGAALVVDEVFRGFPLDLPAPGPTAAAQEACLTFTLGGLSKELGLPQLKLAWIVLSGPEGPVEQAAERLAYVADQYLSVGTPVQLALPDLLVRAAPVRSAISARCRGNLAALRHQAPSVPQARVLPVEGGWSAVLRVPAVPGEEDLVLALLEEASVAVQPGYFFDFEREGHLVLSLLPPPDVFLEGSGRLLAHVRAAAR